MPRKIETAVTIISAIGLVYIGASFLDVNAHNLNETSIAEWNFFNLFTEEEVVIPSDGGEYEATSEIFSTPKLEELNKEDADVLVVGEQAVDYELQYKLAQLMYAENGINEDSAIFLTGIVALKRVKSDDFPNTLEEVIAQDGQYQCYQNGAINCEPDERCMEIAEEILRWNMEEDYPDNLVFQSEFAQGTEIYEIIGNQYFCLK